jgi:hypothetical protein
MTFSKYTCVCPNVFFNSSSPVLDRFRANLKVACEGFKISLKRRGSRQVIFVTHNPNMPVLGEAERVFVFSSDGQHSTLKQVGTVDECVRWCRCRASTTRRLRLQP